MRLGVALLLGEANGLRDLRCIDLARHRKGILSIGSRRLVFLIASDPSDHRSARLSQYVLAPKAFEALRVGLPKSLREKGDQEHQSVGDKIKALAKRTGKEAAKEGTKQLIAKAITFVIGLATGGTPGTGEA